MIKKNKNVKKLGLKNNNLDYIYKTIFNNKNISFYKFEEIYNCFSNPNIDSIVIMFLSHSSQCNDIWDNFVSTLTINKFDKFDKFDNIVIKYDKIINYNSFDNYIKDVMCVADINYTKKNRYIIYGKQVYDYHKLLCVEQFTENASFSYYMKYTNFILFSESDNYYIHFISEYGKLSIYFVQNNKLNPIKCRYSNINNIMPLIFVPKNISDLLLYTSRKLTHKNLIIAYKNEQNKQNEFLYLGS